MNVPPKPTQPPAVAFAEPDIELPVIVAVIAPVLVASVIVPEKGIHRDSTIIAPNDATFDVGVEPDAGGICNPESCEDLAVACGVVDDDRAGIG